MFHFLSKELLSCYRVYEKRLSDLGVYGLKSFLGQHIQEACEIENLCKQDKRFQDPEWDEAPFFKLLKQTYFVQKDFILSLFGLMKYENEQEKKEWLFFINYLCDIFSPSNCPFTNPVVLKKIAQSGGTNLQTAWDRLVTDATQNQFLTLDAFVDLQKFKIGENIATTKGKVVFRTPLLEVICYKPLCATRSPHPVLIVPSWINKFYICDLESHNSFVQFFLKKGISVFIVSWTNKKRASRYATFFDYIKHLQKAMVFIHSRTNQTLHCMGYCAGGVALLIAQQGLSKIVQTLTLMAVPVDFEKIGDMRIFLNNSVMQKIHDLKEKNAFLPGQAIANIFTFLKFNDLIWRNIIDVYYLNKEKHTRDFLHWNCDCIDVPARMYFDYLKATFIDNGLIQKTIFYNEQAIDLSMIDKPLFIMAAQKDHIVSCGSAFALRDFCANATCVLGGGGHVGGVIHPPPGKYGYTMSTNKKPFTKGQHNSWWIELSHWLFKNSDSHSVTVSAYEDFPHLGDAPGTYV